MKKIIIAYIFSLFIQHNAQCIEVLTNNQPADGFGSQYQELIDTVAYAELHNKHFVYTPFKKMEHNYDNDPDFLPKKEALINFIGYFETIDHIDKDVKVITLSDNIYKNYFDAHPAECAKTCSFKKIKRIFRQNKQPKTYFDSNHLHIAIHVRKFNPHDTRVYGTDTPDSVFLTIIDELREKFEIHRPLFHIYSQGTAEMFKAFNAPDIILHLNDSVEDTFTSMVFADVLVTAISSLSYTAGLLSDGIIYYTPFWHSPLPHWISVKELLTKEDALQA